MQEKGRKSIQVVLRVYNRYTRIAACIVHTERVYAQYLIIGGRSYKKDRTRFYEKK